MAICAYRKCQKEFVPNPKHIGSKNEQLYCIKQHGVNERSLVRSEKNRHPIVKKICKNERCKKPFKTRDTKKKHCCVKCQQATARLKRLIVLSKKDFSNTGLRDKRDLGKKRESARVYAAINCTLYRQCVNAEKLPCLNCEKKNIQIDAYKSELEYPIYNHNSGGENRMNLPSRGTV